MNEYESPKGKELSSLHSDLQDMEVQPKTDKPRKPKVQLNSRQPEVLDAEHALSLWLEDTILQLKNLGETGEKILINKGMSFDFRPKQTNLLMPVFRSAGNYTKSQAVKLSDFKVKKELIEYAINKIDLFLTNHPLWGIESGSELIRASLLGPFRDVLKMV